MAYAITSAFGASQTVRQAAAAFDGTAMVSGVALGILGIVSVIGISHLGIGLFIGGGLGLVSIDLLVKMCKPRPLPEDQQENIKAGFRNLIEIFGKGFEGTNGKVTIKWEYNNGKPDEVDGVKNVNAKKTELTPDDVSTYLTGVWDANCANGAIGKSATLKIKTKVKIPNFYRTKKEILFNIEDGRAHTKYLRNVN